MALGFSASLYWSLTPREVVDHIKAGSRRLTREHDLAMTSAWINARLTAYAPAKGSSFTKLETLLAPEPKRTKQTVGEMIAIARQWDAAVKALATEGSAAVLVV